MLLSTDISIVTFDWKSPAFAQTRIVSTDLIPAYLNVLTSFLLMQKNLFVTQVYCICWLSVG